MRGPPSPRLALRRLSLGLSLVGLLHGDALRYPSETPIDPTSRGRSRLCELTLRDAPASFWHGTRPRSLGVVNVPAPSYFPRPTKTLNNARNHITKTLDNASKTSLAKHQISHLGLVSTTLTFMDLPGTGALALRTDADELLPQLCLAPDTRVQYFDSREANTSNVYLNEAQLEAKLARLVRHVEHTSI